MSRVNITTKTYIPVMMTIARNANQSSLFLGSMCSLNSLSARAPTQLRFEDHLKLSDNVVEAGREPG
jgi:hypothetical protein